MRCVRFPRKSRFAALAAALILMAVVTSAFPPSTFAGESPFGWIYTADTHPKGKKEFEQWIETQRDQSQGDYTNVRLRHEIEYGVSDNYQIAFYVNERYVNAYRNGIDGTTGGPDVDPPSDFDPMSRYKKFRFESAESVSMENLYRVSNPYIDPIGLALYLEPSIGPRGWEIESKFILQKNFLDDRLIWALNVNNEVEKEKSATGEIERATVLDLLTGLSYRFRNNWSAGAEARNHREFTGYGFGQPDHSAWFFGPNVHYGTKAWWVTAAWRQQLKVASGFTEEQRAVIYNGRIYGEEHARNELMVRVGVPF